VVFEKCDQNKDGYLGLPEIESYLNDAMKVQEGRLATPEEVRLFVQASDLDCDQKISKMELFKILKLSFNSA
jgi:Ca2+-binding EF-hand superfamily protein